MTDSRRMPPVLAGPMHNRWEGFCEAAVAAGVPIPEDERLIEAMQRVFACSEFVARGLQLHPDWLIDFRISGDLAKPYPAGEYPARAGRLAAETGSDGELGQQLRLFRNREMVRIAWRDLAGQATLEETLTETSDLAAACIDRAFEVLYRRCCLEMGTPTAADGSPLKVVVLGMGKLGARELNFSSDIDLMFAFPEVGQTSGGPRPIDNETFFVGLCRRFLKVFAEKGPDGILYRVDLRLRPFGENGPLVMSFNATEEYYQCQGREWERYALIKAGVVAGDCKAGQQLLKRLRPFIYRRYLDYGVYESLREMKRNIAAEVARKGLDGNIKIGAGGIREIEFFGQIFQLVRGGVEAHLQEPRILPVLNLLAQEAYITRKVGDELTAAYIFLRRVENHLQAYADQQVHVLPSDDLPRLRLAFSLGYADWGSLVAEVARHTSNVHFHFNDLLVVAETEDRAEAALESELAAVWQGLADDREVERILSAAGYGDSASVRRLLDDLKSDSATRSLSPKARAWLDRLIPLVLVRIGAADDPGLTLKRIVELIRAVEQRSCYISLLLENPEALTHLVRLASASPWIVSFLAAHPILLDELLDRRTLYQPPRKAELEKSLHRRLQQIEGMDLEKQLEELIIFKNVNVFQVAAADIAGAFQLMKVSDYLSDTAETVLKQVLELSWRRLVRKYGEPASMLDGEPCAVGFVIIAYGKLGGYELSYGSDLDLVFLNAAAEGETRGQGPVIDNRQFYIRLGQRIVHLLTAHTRAGRLYEIDMRLRPNGSSGVLVSRIDAYGEYQTKEAWTWEHQALIRARPIAGDPRLIERFSTIRKRILMMKRDPGSLRHDIRTMRQKMRREKEKRHEGTFDIKQGIGGIIDIEFLVQYLVLLHAWEVDELVRWTDNVRLIGTLNKNRLLDNDTANTLRGAYLGYRSRVHRLNLQEKDAVVPADSFDGLQDKVRAIWERFLA